MKYTSRELPHFRIASFDPGKKNFAQYVEDCSIDDMTRLEDRYKSLPKQLQRRIKGVMNDDISNILNDLYLGGERVHLGVFDFTEEEDEPREYSLQARKNLLNHLSSFKKLWDTCDVFIIEQQYFRTFSPGGKFGRKNKGTEANVDAIKIAETIYMWFLERYPRKIITLFGSQFKTQILGAPWKMTKPQRKKWSEEKAREIYESRSDEDAMELYRLKERVFRKRINTEEKVQSFLDTFESEKKDMCYLAEKIVRERQKLDDVADTCVQCQAFKFKTMVACF